MTDTTPSAPPRGFELSEYERRTERAQSLMCEAGLGALLLTTEPEVRYFTGFHSQFWESPTRPWFALVPATGKPIAVIPEIGLAGMQATWIDDIRTWPAPRPEDDGVSLLAEAIAGIAPGTGAIGAALGHESHLRMPAADFRRLQDGIAPVAFADAQPLLRALRNIKSAAEIAKIAYVCAVASDAFLALPQRLEIGIAETEACKRLRLDMIQRGADSVPYLIAGSGPGGYDSIIMGPSGRMIGPGDVLIIDTGARYDGYFCDFDRNFAFGAVDDATRRAHETVYAATEAGLRAARPGATMADLFHAMWKVLDAGGALGNDVGRMGHGLGMQLTEGPSITSFDKTVLDPGMVVTLEPGMAFAPSRQMVHEENIVITDEGNRLLSRRAPPEMPRIG